jgi:hypothetical protein
MNAPAKRDVLDEVDELQLEIVELRGILQVCSAAALTPGDVPGEALADTLSHANRTLGRILDRATRIGQFAIAAARGCVPDDIEAPTG